MKMSDKNINKISLRPAGQCWGAGYMYSLRTKTSEQKKKLEIVPNIFQIYCEL